MKMIKNLLRGSILVCVISIMGLYVFSWQFYDVDPLDATRYLAARVGSATGTEVEVSENPYNTLAQQLREREEELDEREAVLLETLEERESDNRVVSNLMLGLILVLFVLLFINFYLDYSTRKEELGVA